LPPSFEARNLYLQAAILDAAGGIWLANPTTVVLLDLAI